MILIQAMSTTHNTLKPQLISVQAQLFLTPPSSRALLLSTPSPNSLNLSVFDALQLLTALPLTVSFFALILVVLALVLALALLGWRGGFFHHRPFVVLQLIFTLFSIGAIFQQASLLCRHRLVWSMA